MSEKKSLFSRLKDGLFKSRQQMAQVMDDAVREDRAIDEDLYDELLDALILSDMGAKCAEEAIEALRKVVAEKKLKNGAQAKEELKQILVNGAALAGRVFHHLRHLLTALEQTVLEAGKQGFLFRHGVYLPYS